MIKMGVPHDGVQQRMIIDKLDPSVLDRFNKKHTSHNTQKSSHNTQNTQKSSHNTQNTQKSSQNTHNTQNNSQTVQKITQAMILGVKLNKIDKTKKSSNVKKGSW